MSEDLHEAILDENIELLQSLLKNGDYVNYQRRMDRGTPLHVAVAENNIEAVQILIEAGADTAALNIFEEPPAMYINENTDPKIVEIFQDPGFPDRFKRFLDNQINVVKKEMKKCNEILSNNQEHPEGVKSRYDRGVRLLENIDAVNWLHVIDHWATLIGKYLMDQSNQDRVEFEWDFEAQPSGLFMDVAGQESGYVIIDIGNFYDDRIKKSNWKNLDWRSKDSYDDIADRDLWFNIFSGAVKEALYIACEKDSCNIQKIVIRFHTEQDWVYILHNGEICLPGWPSEEWM